MAGVSWGVQTEQRTVGLCLARLAGLCGAASGQAQKYEGSVFFMVSVLLPTFDTSQKQVEIFSFS